MNFRLDLDTEPVTRANPQPPLTIEPERSIREVLVLMKERQTGSVLICQGDRLVGIFTERDALQLMAGKADLDGTNVGDVMTTEPATIKEDAPVAVAIKQMSVGGYRRLPVVDAKGRPVSIVKVSGILHYLVEHFPQFVYNLPPAPHHATQHREGA